MLYKELFPLRLRNVKESESCEVERVTPMAPVESCSRVRKRVPHAAVAAIVLLCSLNRRNELAAYAAVLKIPNTWNNERPLYQTGF